VKALASVVLVLAVCLSTIVRSSAADEKTLSNVRGAVWLDRGPGTPSQPVAAGANVSIADDDYAVTGGVVNDAPSQGAIALANSSVILIGQNTRVQMKRFDQQPNLATASFIILNGKLRFAVKHPTGAKANYIFQTSTGQIAVRGTEGDIWAPQPGGLQVNVYSLTDPSLPVEVRLNDGKVYTLGAGQTLTVGIAGAIVAAAAASQSAAISSTSQASMDNFSEFGAPGQSVAATAAVAGAAVSGGIPVAAAVAAGAAVIGGVALGTGGGGSGSSSSTVSANVKVNPSALSFAPGTGPLTFRASQNGFSGTFHASIDQSAVATVNPASSGGDFTVTPKGNGSATVTVTGGSGRTAAVGVSVSATGIAVPSSLPAFTSLHQSQSFSAQEIYYGGAFSAKSSNLTIAKVTSPASSSSSSGAFTVTSIGNGSTTIVVSDSLGHTSPVGVTVNAAPTPTSVPICIGMPGAGEHLQGARHEADPTTFAAAARPNPQASPTCPPTPMAAPPIARPSKPVREPQPQPHPIGPQPAPIVRPGLPGMPTPPPMPGSPP